MASIINQLNGDKYLVLGNHDKRRPKGWWRDVGFVEVYSGPIERTPFLLSHEPVDVDNKINICGHVHNTVELLYKNCLNVCVEPRDYKPISYAEIFYLYCPTKRFQTQEEAKLDNF